MGDASTGTAADSATDSAADRAVEHEAARLRGPQRLLLWGPLGAFLVAIGTGLLGADGTAGFLVFLLLLAVTFGATGLWVGGGLLLDEFRGGPTSLRRSLLTLGMFVATLACMAAIGGVATSLGNGA